MEFPSNKRSDTQELLLIYFVIPCCILYAHIKVLYSIL